MRFTTDSVDSKPIQILLVEDNSADVRLLRELLKEISVGGFVLTVASRIGEALAKLAAESFDVVLTDLSLPDSRNLDSFHELHSAAPTVPIIVLSGLDDESLAASAVREGAQDYLFKTGLDSHILGRSIRHAIERHVAEQKLVRSEAFYHSLVEHLPQNIFRKDLGERFTFANQRFCQLLGKPLDQIIGKTDLDFYPPELAKVSARRPRSHSDRPDFETIEENVAPDGEKMPCMW